MNRINRFLVSFMLLVIAIYSAPSVAEADGVEWRLLGPAFSKHASKQGAAVTKDAHLSMHCRMGFEGELGECSEPKMVYAERGWNESNPAFGIERTAPSSEGASSRDKIFATFVRDSYDRPGFMAGAGRQWPVAAFGSLSLQAGISGGLWYRTVNTGDKKAFCYRQTVVDGRRGTTQELISSCRPINENEAEYVVGSELKRVIIPFVLPFIEITERHTGLGVNLALAPKIRLGNYYAAPTTTLLLQVTYKVSF